LQEKAHRLRRDLPLFHPNDLKAYLSIQHDLKEQYPMRKANCAFKRMTRQYLWCSVRADLAGRFNGTQIKVIA
jgi:hypothetical protein